MFKTKNIFLHTQEIFMSDNKTFRFAGVSTRNGVCKARFANDQMRVKVLAKTGSKDIDLVELKYPMTKLEAVKYLISIDFATRDGKTNATVQAALEAALEKREPVKAKKAPKVAKAPKAKKTTPSMDAIKARAKAVKASASKTTVTKAEVEAQLAGLEDAPF
jgi:hypothetical protein